MDEEKNIPSWHNIENATGDPDGWKTIINGRPVASKLTLVKKSIDWWCDMKAFMPPEKFAGVDSQPQHADQKKSKTIKALS